MFFSKLGLGDSRSCESKTLWATEDSRQVSLSISRHTAKQLSGLLSGHLMFARTAVMVASDEKP